MWPRSSSWQDSARAGEKHKKIQSYPCPGKLEKLQGARFPPEIRALPHVLEMINDLLLAPEGAIITAVKRNEQQWLNYLLGKFDRNVPAALLHGAFNGDEETVAALLPSMYEPGSDELKDAAWDALGEAIIVASRRGHFAVVRLLLPKLVKMKGYIAWSVMGAAAGKGYVDILSFAADIADGEDGNEARVNSSRAVLCAIDGHHSAAATFLVNRYYRDWCLEGELERAIVLGQADVAECIYEAMLKEDYVCTLEETFVGMARESFVHALMYLYRRGHSDSKLVGHAFSSASRSARIDMLTLLLDTGKVSTEAFAEAFEKVARGRWTEKVSFLSSKKLASARLIAHAFESAGDIQVSRYLYDKMQNPAESTRIAFRNAAYVGPRYNYTFMTTDDRMAVVRFLISTGHVPAELITEAFMSAVTNPHFEIVRALCDDPSISFGIKCDAFRQAAEAAEAGRTQVLRFLADKVPIPLRIKREALRIAAQSAQLGAILALCEIEDWSVDVLTKALASTVNARVRVILQGKLDQASTAFFNDP